MNKAWILISIIFGQLQSIPYFADSFTKLLEHDPITGLLTDSGIKNYQQLTIALQTGKQEDFNAINRASGTQRLWASPQSAFASMMDPQQFLMSIPPALSSADAAVDLMSVYVMAACRDVAFSDFGTGQRTDKNKNGESLTKSSARILNKYSLAKVDAAHLFRGNALGAMIGPYLSQFLLQSYLPLFPQDPTEVGAGNLPKRILSNPRHIPVFRQREFGVSWQDFVALQNGLIPRKFLASDCIQKRYPSTGRDLACYVYTDVAYDPYYYALQVLVCNGFPYSKAFPHQQGIMKNESAGITMGLSDVYTLIATVCQEAYKICWYYKWRAFRRLRPEAMAGLLHRAILTGTNEFNVDASLFDTELLALILEHNQKQSDKRIIGTAVLPRPESSTYLLAQVFPEGSPAHPSYPAAHAVIAGACVTIIKAFFDDTALILSKMKPVLVDPANPTKLQYYKGLDALKMTVGSELNKLATNIAYARSWAGIHFISDNEAGLQLGEEIAIAVLKKHAQQYHEQGFKGFEFTKRDGTRIIVNK